MKKLLLLITISALLGSCVVYPGYYDYYDSGYYGYPYGYVGPNVNFHFDGFYGGGGHYGGFGHHHGGHGGWHR